MTLKRNQPPYSYITDIANANYPLASNWYGFRCCEHKIPIILKSFFNHCQTLEYVCENTQHSITSANPPTNIRWTGYFFTKLFIEEINDLQCPANISLAC